MFFNLLRATAVGSVLLASALAILPSAAQAQAPGVVIEMAPGAPPPPQVEVVPPPPPGRVEIVQWVPGRWRWDGRGWGWVPGHYVERPAHRAHWIPGHWDARPTGWVWVEGHWR